MRHNLPFSPDMEVATTDQIFPMVQHNLGIGFFPEELAAEHIAQGKIVQIPIEEPLPERKICLIRNVKGHRALQHAALKNTSHHTGKQNNCYCRQQYPKNRDHSCRYPVCSGNPCFIDVIYLILSWIS